MRWALLALVVAGSPVEAAPDFSTASQRVMGAYNDGADGAMRELFTPAMDKAFSPDAAKEVFGELWREHGRIARLGKLQVLAPNTGLIPLHLERGILDLKLVLLADGKIAGMWFLPHVEPIPVPESHQTKITFPLQGRWLIYWGGATLEQNHHAQTRNQRWAFDILGVGRGSKTRRGESDENEDYYCFGREIRSFGKGLVTDVITGVRDNRPGSLNPYSALGNAVVVKHRDHEVSVFAHLKQGSVRVKKGDRVTTGQPLGQCGNSGNSSEPHLHYHMQNTPILQDGTGIPVVFDILDVKGKGRKRLFSPVKGDVIFNLNAP
ncbi:MAG: hypothetical protein COB53_10735 [Elusimicrobia bacterium]|nr:MAG: hypothetical protein COB53_10735 [Elusimicrobiota bacterium]